jgi:hypothetical protein
MNATKLKLTLLGCMAVLVSCIDKSGDSLIEGQTQQAATTNIQAINYNNIDWDGTLAFQTQLDNWAPTGIQTDAVIEIRAADNNGSLITGISSTNINVGDVRWVCNFNAPSDDGMIALSGEDTNSTAANRIFIPGLNSSTLTQRPERYIINTDTCAELMYSEPNQDTTTKRWVVINGHGPHQYRSIVQSLQLFPDNTPDSTTITELYMIGLPPTSARRSRAQLAVRVKPADRRTSTTTRW